MRKSGCGSGLVLAHEKLVRREEIRYDVKYKRIPKNTNPSLKPALRATKPSYTYSLRHLPSITTYAGSLPTANVPTINNTPLPNPNPAPPSAALPTPSATFPLLAAAAPASAPTPAAPTVSQSVLTSP